MTCPTDHAPTVAEVEDNCRLIAVFPLSGRLDTGAHVYFAEYVDGEPHYWIIDRTHWPVVLPIRFTALHDVIRRALSNCGWGDYTITPPEGSSW